MKSNIYKDSSLISDGIGDLMPRVSKSVVAIILVVLGLLLSSIPLPFASASSEENIPLSGILSNPYSLSGSDSLSYSNDGQLMAVAYLNKFAIIDSSSRTFVTYVDVGSTILSLTFSNDDSSLLVGLDSPYSSSMSIAIYNTVSWERTSLNEDGKEVTDISMLPNSELFASSIENNGAAEYYISDSTNAVNTYDGVHTDDVTCLDHSPNGQQLVTGGKDGFVHLWNRTTITPDFSWDVQFSITDCSISPDGTQLAWIADSLLQVRSLPGGEYISSLSIEADGIQLEWDSTGEELWVLVQASSPTLLIFNSSNYQVINSLFLGQQVSKFAKAPAEAEFIVSSNTGYITIFKETPWQPFAGLPGVDTDGDGTPDNYDSDDDGDGIGDNFEFSCPEVTECSLHPDKDLVRQVSIQIQGDKITIEDRYQLNASQSAPIRQLASSSVHADSYVDTGEATRMEKVLCGGTNEGELSQAWMDAVKINNSAVMSSTVWCDAKLGLSDTERVDSKTRIQLRWFIEINLANDVDRPFNMTVDPSIEPPQHTTAQIAPSSPFTISVFFESDLIYYDSPTFSTESSFQIDVDLLPAPDPTIVDLSISWLIEYFWIPSLIIISIVVLYLVIERRRNQNLFDFDDEEEYENVVTKRRKSKRPQPERPPDRRTSSKRPQPFQPPQTVSRRKQPTSTPDKRPVRRVRKTPGSSIQSGDAPEGKEWDYSEHGAYWDSDDPSAEDPYGEVKEYHDEEKDTLDIAEEIAAETKERESKEASTDEKMDEALSMLTGTKTSTASDGDKKTRRKVKRRKK